MGIQATSFGFTKKVYAFDVASFSYRPGRPGEYVHTCTIVKFGRRTATKRRAAFRGTAMVVANEILTYEEFLTRITSLHAENSWDGEEVWGYTKLKAQIELADYLGPLLDSCPNLPSGFDAWYEVEPKSPRY